MLRIYLRRSKPTSRVYATVIFLLTISTGAIAQGGINAIEVSESNSNNHLYRTGEISMKLGAVSKPYALYGNDFNGAGHFYVSFDLESRQKVSYQFIDMMGKQLASDDLNEVMNQTYRIDVNNISGGAYIVRLYIDRKCYTEKIFFTP